jgi:hypothetical protein
VPLRATVLPIAASALAGCAAIRQVEGPVRLGQIAFVNGPRMRADRVIEDSRCPLDAQCVWAGRLVVRATVLGGGWARQLDLTLGKPVTAANGSLPLVGATPRRWISKQRSKPLPYRFTFDFKGGL